MTQYKIKIFKQLTGECCKIIPCEKHILQEVKEEYTRIVESVDLPDGAYFSILYMGAHNCDEKDKQVDGSIIYPLISKNHQTSIN